MSYTVIQAKYVNKNHTEIHIYTNEAAWVAVNEADRPDLWRQVMESGIEIEPYVDPKPELQDPGEPIVVHGSDT